MSKRGRRMEADLAIVAKRGCKRCIFNPQI